MKKVSVILILFMLLIICLPVYASSNLTLESTASPSVVLYKENARINAFLNAFNMVNPDNQFTTSQFKSYYHHGRSHEEQAIASIDNIEILITEYTRSDIQVIIKGTRETTTEIYRALFFEYAKAFNSELDETTFDNYWQEINSRSYNGGGEFDEFSVDLSKFNNSTFP